MKPVALEHPWLWVVDHTLPVLGLLLLLLGATAAPAALPFGWTAIGLTLFAWVAEVEGFAVPRPGRTPIVGYGCYEVPQAFAVRHRGRCLLLSRDEDPETGGWTADYAVRELPGFEAAGLRGVRCAFPGPGERIGAVLGRVPVAALRFEHRERTSYVVTASLARALRATA